MAIERRPNQQDLSWFLDLHKQEKLNLNPDYQRKSVWMPKDKRFFLDTIINNYPCPAIYLQKETDSNFSTKYNVVDGKQRLTTVIDFYNNKIRLPDDLGDTRLNNKKWSEIEDDSVKKRFLSYSFTVETLDSIDYAGWNTVFDRLNRNSKTLSHQELRHARFNGWLINRAEQEAESPIWKELKISSTAKARRMKDVEFISILMLIILEQKIVGFPQSALDALYTKYEVTQNDVTEDEFFDLQSFQAQVNEDEESQLEFDEQVASYIVPQGDIESFELTLSKIKLFLIEFNKISQLITENKLFGSKRTTHLYTLWSYLSLREIPTDVNIFKVKYEDFFNVLEKLRDSDEGSWNQLGVASDKLELAIKYHTNSMGPTTEAPQRHSRLEALNSFLAL